MANSWSRRKHTKEGSDAVWLINKTGGASVKGELLRGSATTADAVEQAGANCFDTIGITYESGIADGKYMWVVDLGRCQVKMDAGGAALQDRLIASATAGRADVGNTPSSADHFKEIGHSIGTAGANALVWAMVHLL